MIDRSKMILEIKDERQIRSYIACTHRSLRFSETRLRRQSAAAEKYSSPPKPVSTHTAASPHPLKPSHAANTSTRRVGGWPRLEKYIKWNRVSCITSDYVMRLLLPRHFFKVSLGKSFLGPSGIDRIDHKPSHQTENWSEANYKTFSRHL